MIKKLFFLLLISFTIFLGTLYYNKKKKEQVTNYIHKIENINVDLDKLDMEPIVKLGNEASSFSGSDKMSEKEVFEKMIAEQLTDIDSIKFDSKNKKLVRYQKIYLYQIKQNNILLAIKSIKYILKYTKNKKIWYEKIVDLYTQIGNFKEAKKYLEKLLKLDPSKENFKKYLNITLQTTNFFDKKEVEKLNKLIVTLYKNNIISLSDLTFYTFLLDLLVNWNTKNLIPVIDEILGTIQDPVKKQLLIAIKEDYNKYKNSKGSPDYYFKSLVALDLLKFGYFGLAKNIAENVYIQDSSYVLPKQILAYSYFYMGNYKQAIKYFQELKVDSKGNTADYDFFIGISYFWLGDYQNALLFLSQLKKGYIHYLDVLRYKLLSYIKLKNNSNANQTIEELSSYKLSAVDYYNIFNYLLIKCPFCYKTHKDLLVKLLKSCYKDVEKDERYICWYGKANVYYKFGYIDKSVPYFKAITKYFQDAYIYDVLAKYYEKKNDFNKAKYYYVKELIYTSSEPRKKIIKNKIKELILKSAK